MVTVEIKQYHLYDFEFLNITTVFLGLLFTYHINWVRSYINEELPELIIQLLFLLMNQAIFVSTERKVLLHTRIHIFAVLHYEGAIKNCLYSDVSNFRLIVHLNLTIRKTNVNDF